MRSFSYISRNGAGDNTSNCEMGVLSPFPAPTDRSCEEPRERPHRLRPFSFISRIGAGDKTANCEMGVQSPVLFFVGAGNGALCRALNEVKRGFEVGFRLHSNSNHPVDDLKGKRRAAVCSKGTAARPVDDYGRIIRLRFLAMSGSPSGLFPSSPAARQLPHQGDA